MKKITASVFLHRFLQSSKKANSIIFSRSKGSVGSKLGRIRSLVPSNSISNFTIFEAFVEIDSLGNLTIKNPWNATFGFCSFSIQVDDKIVQVGNQTFLIYSVCQKKWTRIDFSSQEGQRKATRYGGFWQQLSGYQAEYGYGEGNTGPKYTGRWRYNEESPIEDPMLTPAGSKKIFL